MPIAFHIPDGFLSTEVALAAWLPAIAAVAFALRVAGRQLDDERVPLLGVLAAFVFAVQMLTFPVAGGTSGHLVGAALVAVLLGPWLACLVMTVVLGAQAFLFADGGITALGANIVVMGLLGAWLAGLVFGWAQRAGRSTRPVFLGLVGAVSWAAVMLGAAVTAILLGVSETVPLGTALGAMLGVHALIGIGEALITVAAVSAVLASRPDLLSFRPAEAHPVLGRVQEA